MTTNARQAEVNPEYADAQLCPRLTALRELYALLVACVRNHGARTAHHFRHVDAELAKALAQLAEAEGFVVGADTDGGATVLTVSER